MVGIDGNPIGGHNDRVLVFPSKEAVEQHCSSAIEGRPAIGCLIYDSNGKFVTSFVNPARLAELAQPPSRINLLIKGLLWLVAGGALMWWDWSRRWTIMIGIIVGIRFAVTGVVFLWRAGRRRRHA